ncbi:MAG: hypothetical protein ACPH5V_05730, partial [Alcanivorax sp.]
MSVAVPLQRRVNAAIFFLALVVTTGLVSRCEADKAPVVPMMELTVTASAYNSLHGQGRAATMRSPPGATGWRRACRPSQC